MPPSARPWPADLRLVLPAAAAWAAAAVALTAPGRSVVLGTVCCLTAAGGALWWAAAHGRSRPLAVAVAAALLCGAAGGTVAGLHGAAARAGPLPGLTGERVRVEVRVTGDPTRPRERPGTAGQARRPVLLPAEVTRLRSADGGERALTDRVLLVVHAERPDAWLSLLPSARLDVAARVVPPMPGRTWELAAVLRVRESGPPRVTQEPDARHRFAGRLRAGLREAASGLPGDAATLLPALVIGDDSRVPADLHEAVEASGLTHLVAVSGSQVAIVLGVLLGRQGTASLAERRGLAARLGIPLRPTAVLGGVLVAAFVLVCRPDPSVLRAAACAGIALLALATGRRRTLLPALAAGVLLLVLYRPELARSFGFLLSVLATGALLILAQPWADALRRRRVPAWLAEALAAALAAHIVCAPVVTVFAASTSLVAVPCNLLAGPAVAPVIVLGWAAMALAPLAPGPAEALVGLAGWPVRWIAAVARTGAALPGAESSWPGGWWGAALLAGATLVCVPVVRRIPGRPWVAAACALLILLAVLRPPPLTRLLTGWPPPGWRVVACDVGQGDALVLAAGPGRAVVIDAGPEPGAVDRCLHGLGVRHVPLLVLTHFHADHVGGLPGVLRGRAVDAVRTSGVREPVEQAAFVTRVTDEAGIPVRVAVPGERYRVGEGLSWEVLWPPEDARTGGLGANDSSVTLLVRVGGLTVFLPGDLEPLAQQRLLARHPGLPRVDVLKVAHHGSAAQHPPLLARLRPRIALISCGEDNRYGHPAPRTLAALSSVGAAVLRTDTHGPLAVTETPGGPRGHARRGA
ncbi:ComEC/Rec2 family competence protein [Streptomyces marincola]|nr:ComEC/Rec2 family competence protein [Streptomyces marincola]UCM91742.1 ComEC/Rec2 family competence protein [Streptomyces marincola]